ncbi:recombinase family protein [Georgenia subflava]|uniref:Resolvase/invertase-type recombinase catalytic domain-containing protein n=1 Tax=Georgenia subflava TaxID=1622177 RepID=A0A6N7EIA2_9MICO|nr:recombinase family protein [Georgenia subflava]MPV36718.1 hypothetical protein [Georgenia subflava]
MHTRWGYVRVDSVVPAEPQLKALRGLVQEMFVDDDGDWPSGRHEWQNLLRRVPPGSTVYVWRGDRLGATFPEIATAIHSLRERGVSLRSIVDEIDPFGEGLVRLSQMAAQDQVALAHPNGAIGANAEDVEFHKAQAVAMLIALKGWPVEKAGQVVGWPRSTAYRKLLGYHISSHALHARHKHSTARRRRVVGPARDHALATINRVVTAVESSAPGLRATLATLGPYARFPADARLHGERTRRWVQVGVHGPSLDLTDAPIYRLQIWDETEEVGTLLTTDVGVLEQAVRFFTRCR